MSGSRVLFIGDAMAAVVQGVTQVRALTGRPPIIVGGLAVLSRLSNPYRATTDLDVVDRLLGDAPQLQVLRAAAGAEPVEPTSVVLPTVYGPVRIDVLEVRQVELDQPSDDPGDRLHAAAHGWANDTASDVTIEVRRTDGQHIEVTTPVAEPGPLIAMKLQAVMNRSAAKQGTDLGDILRLTLDRASRSVALSQIGDVDSGLARDMAMHVDLWFVRRRHQALRWIRDSGGEDVTTGDLDLVAELLLAACER
ncbi:MAG: prevent-host-death protein [Angustibacter sp.]